MEKCTKKGQKNDGTCRNENILLSATFRYTSSQTLAGGEGHICAMGNRLLNMQKSRNDRPYVPRLLGRRVFMGRTAAYHQKRFPLRPPLEFGISLLNLRMLITLHRIWKCRMAIRHADVDARPARQYFKESITCFVEEQKLLEDVPDWLNRVELLLQMKEF